MSKRPHSRVRLPLSIAAGLLTVVGLAAVATPASARTAGFRGAGPDALSCAWSAKVSFAPALTNAGGGTGTSSISAGDVFSCYSSDGLVPNPTGKMTGFFASSPLNCTTLSATGISPTLNISWRGDLDGSIGGTTYSGKAHFTDTSIHDGSASGSFAGGATFSVYVPSNLATLCATRKGIKKVTLAGSLTTGTSQVLWTTEPTTSTPSYPVSGPPTVHAEDQEGHLVPGATYVMAVSTGPGTFTTGSTTSIGPIPYGGAAFSNLVLDTAGFYTITASVGSVQSPASSSFEVGHLVGSVISSSQGSN